MIDIEYVKDNSLNQALVDMATSNPALLQKYIDKVSKALDSIINVGFAISQAMANPCQTTNTCRSMQNCNCSCNCSDETTFEIPDEVKELYLYILEGYYTNMNNINNGSCNDCYDPNVESMSMPGGFTIKYKTQNSRQEYQSILGVNLPAYMQRLLERYDMQNLLRMGRFAT